ncbi:MAG: hypothetical protein FWE16_03400 [Firmicutes bacterium]|nr:hypothetical protein [Bacillota bacterium]
MNSQYHSTKFEGIAKFDYSNNNGIYRIGEGEYLFDLKFSKASNTSIHVYSDSPSVKTVALVKDVSDINMIRDTSIYDSSSRTRAPSLNQIVVLQNINGYFAAIKILSLKDDTRGDLNDEVEFEYVIQINGSSDFTNGNSKPKIKKRKQEIKTEKETDKINNLQVNSVTIATRKDKKVLWNIIVPLSITIIGGTIAGIIVWIIT